MRKGISLTTIVVLMTAMLIWFAGADEGPSYLAIPFDVSGSMREHGFHKAKSELTEYLVSLPVRTHFWIIPFAENELPTFEGELTEADRDAALREAESFIDGLEAGGKRGDSYGFFTNMDEGVDAGKLVVLQQPGPGRRSVVLISDGISDPDTYHHPVDVQKLAKKIPDSVHLYLIDLTGDDRQLPASWKQSIGSVQGFQVPQSTVALIPVSADRLREVLGQLPVQEHATVKPEEAPKPKAMDKAMPPVPKPEPSPWRQMLPWILISLAAIGVICLILIGTKKVKKQRGKMSRLTQEKAAIVKRSTQRKVERTLVLSVEDTPQRKNFPLKPFTSIKFGTQEGVDLLLADPDRGRIAGQIEIDENGKLILVNSASTFPFTVDGDAEVDQGQQYRLPERADVQVSKDVLLNISVEVVPETTTVGSAEELIKKYRTKEATE